MESRTAHLRCEDPCGPCRRYAYSGARDRNMVQLWLKAERSMLLAPPKSVLWPLGLWGQPNSRPCPLHSLPRRSSPPTMERSEEFRPFEGKGREKPNPGEGVCSYGNTYLLYICQSPCPPGTGCMPLKSSSTTKGFEVPNSSLTPCCRCRQ